MTPEEQAELHYLRWFIMNADFGPAHCDHMAHLNEWYTRETGHEVPEKYQDEEE